MEHTRPACWSCQELTGSDRLLPLGVVEIAVMAESGGVWPTGTAGLHGWKGVLIIFWGAGFMGY